MTAPAADRSAPYTRALAGVGLPEWLSWSVRVSDRRRGVGATIEPGGAVVFAVPSACTPERAAAAVRRMRARVVPAADDARENGVRLVTKDLVSGEGFELLGRSNRLKLVDDGPACEVRRLPIGQRRADGTGSMGSLPFLALRRDAANARTVIEWYRAQGQAWLDEHMPRLCERVGIPAADLPTWTVRPYRPAKGYSGAWGTYRPATHSIDVEWLVFQFPRDRVEYIAVHEAAHAKLRGRRPRGEGPHGRLWQAIVGRVVWDWRELDRATRGARGVALWLGEVTTPTPAAPFTSAWADALEMTR